MKITRMHKNVKSKTKSTCIFKCKKNQTILKNFYCSCILLQRHTRTRRPSTQIVQTRNDINAIKVCYR